MRKSKKSVAKKKVKPARLERRVRVTFFLVANTEEEFLSVTKAINYLWGIYGTFGTEFPITGFTNSAVPKPGPLEESVFTGNWWSDVKIDGVTVPSAQLNIEKVVFFLIDFLAPAEEWKLDEDIARLKAGIFSIYKEYGRPQEEIWIVKQDVYRYA